MKMIVKNKKTKRFFTFFFFQINRIPASIFTIKNKGLTKTTNNLEGMKSVPKSINKRLTRNMVNLYGYKSNKRFIILLILN